MVVLLCSAPFPSQVIRNPADQFGIGSSRDPPTLRGERSEPRRMVQATPETPDCVLRGRRCAAAPQHEEGFHFHERSLPNRSPEKRIILESGLDEGDARELLPSLVPL